MNGNELKNAIVETFIHRETTFDDIVAFEPDFIKDTVRQGRWNAFIKKKKAMMKIEFEEAIEQSKKLLLPIVEAIEQNKKFDYQWDRDKKVRPQSSSSRSAVQQAIIDCSGYIKMVQKARKIKVFRAFAISKRADMV